MGNSKQYSDTPLSIKMTKNFKEDLQKLSEITGKTMTDIVISALNDKMIHYRNHNGHGWIAPVAAYRLEGITEYEKKIAEIEGRPGCVDKHECFVLDDIIIYPEHSYYKIYDCASGQIMTVPAESIEFKDETPDNTEETKQIE